MRLASRAAWFSSARQSWRGALGPPRPATPFDLAVCRTLFFGGALALYARFDFGGLAGVAELAWRPVWALQAFESPPLGARALTALRAVWLLALAACCVGLRPRVSMPLAFVSGAPLLLYANSVARAYHTDNLLFWGLYAFAVWGASVRLPAAWVVGFLRAMLVLVFCAAGASKLRNSGLAWADPDTFGSLVVIKSLAWDRAVPHPELSAWIAERRGLLAVLAASALACELAAPAALLSRAAAAILVPALFAMQCGIWLLLGIPFPQTLLCYVFWVPWDRLWPSGWRPGSAAGGRAAASTGAPGDPRR